MKKLENKLEKILEEVKVLICLFPHKVQYLLKKSNHIGFGSI